MKYPIKLALVSLTFLAATGVVSASPPFVDYQWKISSDACLENAKRVLREAGFKRSDSTGTSEVVGLKGEYKGIVACIGEGSEIAVFIVAGPSYPPARKLAMEMKGNF
jgi:hypothetical protein